MHTTCNPSTSLLQHSKGMGFMVLSTLCLSLALLIGQTLLQHMNLMVFIFLRFALAALLLTWVVTVLMPQKLSLANIGTHSVRAIFVILSQYCLFYSVMHDSLLIATLLFATGPIFVPWLARLFYKTPVTRMHVVSIVVSFAGVMMILHPTAGHIHWTVLIGLGSGLFNAISQITMHRVSQQESGLCVNWWMYSLSTVFAVIPLALFWHSVDWHLATQHLHMADLWLVFIIFTFGAISNQSFRARAYSYVNKAASLSPFIYLALVFTALWEWLFFQHVPSVTTVVGAILVVAGGILLLYKKGKPS